MPANGDFRVSLERVLGFGTHRDMMDVQTRDIFGIDYYRLIWVSRGMIAPLKPVDTAVHKRHLLQIASDSKRLLSHQQPVPPGSIMHEVVGGDQVSL